MLVTDLPQEIICLVPRFFEGRDACYNLYNFVLVCHKFHHGVYDNVEFFKGKYSNILMTLILEKPDYGWHWETLSENSDLPINAIFLRPELPWNINCYMNRFIVSNYNLDYFSYLTPREHSLYVECFERLLEEHHLEINGDCEQIKMWNLLSMSPFLRPQFIRKHMDYQWSWKWVCCNINLSEQDIYDFFVHPINETVENNVTDKKRKDRIWELLSRNRAVTMDMIYKHPEWPWNYPDAILNPNVTLKDTRIINEYFQANHIKQEFEDGVENMYNARNGDLYEYNTVPSNIQIVREWHDNSF